MHSVRGTQDQHLQNWFAKHKSQVKSDYFDFLRFRSISTDPECKGELERCATWLKSYLQNGGFQTEIIQTEGAPLVYGEDLSAGSTKATLLLYGHYDVQPVDPIELWKSDPFEPTERDGHIFARGAVDDKGQIFYAVVAAIASKKIHGELPINLKFCIEGEEESNSMGLTKAIPHLKEKLRADYLLLVDFDQFDRKTPAVSLGCRGLLALEVILRGSKTDLHSGMFGGIAYNPNRALVELLSKLWDETGRVQVPNFYDDVVELDPETRSLFESQMSQEGCKKEFGIEALSGEAGKTMQEANTMRPTLEINGLAGGYSGVGIKTVIPAEARAKITCRLVPDQDPIKIGKEISAFLQKQVKPGMKIDVELHPGAVGFRADPKSKLVEAYAKAAEEVCGTKCKRTLSGGSIPVTPLLMRASGAVTAGVGYGLIDDEIHAPNEKFDMDRFEKGFLTIGRVLELL